MTDPKPSRVLAIIDDDMFKMVARIEIGTKDKAGGDYVVRLPLEAKVENALQDESENREKDKEKEKYVPLARLLLHANKGHFYGLKTIRIFDLQAKAAKLLLEGESPTNMAVLLDILNAKEQYPSGLEVAELLDPTEFASRIAWFTATTFVTSEFKPYPLIAKSEIPPVLEDHGGGRGQPVSSGDVPTAHGVRGTYRDTVFLWWAYVFEDLSRDRLGPEMSSREHVNKLRRTALLSRRNVEAAAKDIHNRSNKRAGRGGLAGNVLETVYWQVLEDEPAPEHQSSHGKIREAFLKISGKVDSSGDRESLKKEVGFLTDSNVRATLEMPEILFPPSMTTPEQEQTGLAHIYCMGRAPGQSLSDLAFERIGFHETNGHLKLCLGDVAASHKRVLAEGVADVDAERWRKSMVAHVEKVLKRISDWVRANPMFEALTMPRALIINNQPHFNAGHLYEKIKEAVTDGKLDCLKPRRDAEVLIHGDIVAQNIFVEKGSSGSKIWFIDPKASTADYLVDYAKILSSFTGQGHLEYLRQHPESRCAHFDVNKGADPTRCFYGCSPALDAMATCVKTIIGHIEQQLASDGVYSEVDTKESAHRRLLLLLAGQYLGAPPFRDSLRFDDEMKLLYYRGVEVLNEFCELMDLLPRMGRVLPPMPKR